MTMVLCESKVLQTTQEGPPCSNESGLSPASSQSSCMLMTERHNGMYLFLPHHFPARMADDILLNYPCLRPWLVLFNMENCETAWIKWSFAEIVRHSCMILERTLIALTAPTGALKFLKHSIWVGGTHYGPVTSTFLQRLAFLWTQVPQWPLQITQTPWQFRWFALNSISINMFLYGMDKLFEFFLLIQNGECSGWNEK